MKANRALLCPNCRKRVARRSEHFPFCSRRCRLIDLGEWLSGSYRVAGEKVDLSQDATHDQEGGQDRE